MVGEAGGREKAPEGEEGVDLDTGFVGGGGGEAVGLGVEGAAVSAHGGFEVVWAEKGLEWILSS